LAWGDFRLRLAICRQPRRIHCRSGRDRVVGDRRLCGLLGIVYCELGAALPRAGGIIRYPVFSHGELMGYLLGFITLIAFSSLISIEIVAARQYAAAWFPALTQPGSSSPTLLGGWCSSCCSVSSALNYYSVKTFARSNNFISVLKFLVPLLVVVTLFAFFKPENLHAQGIAPFGMSGVEAAISAGGIIFAYLGLTPIISVASEVQKPQRTIPIALILSVVLSTIIYVLLQLAFLGSIPPKCWRRLGGGEQTVLAAVSRYRHYPRHGLAGLYGD
jgi:amino acid transporter